MERGKVRLPERRKVLTLAAKVRVLLHMGGGTESPISRVGGKENERERERDRQTD